MSRNVSAIKSNQIISKELLPQKSIEVVNEKRRREYVN
jgi:hypothetical protein